MFNCQFAGNLQNTQQRTGAASQWVFRTRPRFDAARFENPIPADSFGLIYCPRIIWVRTVAVVKILFTLARPLLARQNRFTARLTTLSRSVLSLFSYEVNCCNAPIVSNTRRFFLLFE